MKFDVVTIFPDLIKDYLKEGLLSKAIKNKKLQVEFSNPREMTSDRHQTVDDKPYGGDDGMVFLYEPLRKTIEKIKEQNSGRVIYLTPQGSPLNQKKIESLAKEKELILVSGRYAGLDQRWINDFVDEEISIGDYVLMGGELPALVLIEAVARQLDQVLNDPLSKENDSFSNGLLEAPLFTRPDQIVDQKVPSVLTEGHHKKIKDWKEKISYLVTLKKRKDLFLEKLKSANSLTWAQIKEFYLNLSAEDKKSCGLHLPEDLIKEGEQFSPRMSVALFHYPMYDREKKVVSTNITHFDIHDIARASRVNGVQKYFVVHPLNDQQMYVERILDHWRVGIGSKFNPYRKKSLENVVSAANLEEVLKTFPKKPLVIVTHARPVPGSKHYTCQELRQILWQEGQEVLLLFGTGFGFTEEFMKNECDGTLESLRGAPPDDFRHYSVRSAASIYLDRLLGRQISGKN